MHKIKIGNKTINAITEINKSSNLQKAKTSLINLRGKIHKLISSTYVIKNRRFYFEETKEAEMFFRNISLKDKKIRVAYK